MSRTVRRPERHLLKWWLPNLEAVYLTKHPWHMKQTPGVWYSPQEPDIVRCVQSDKHRFFQGMGAFNRRRYQRKAREYMKLRIKHCNEMDTWDSYSHPTLYYPYMW